MKLKEITISKTRTISVDGIMGREKYRKIEYRATFDIGEETNEQAKKFANLFVDECITEEVLKIKKETKNYKQRTKL